MTKFGLITVLADLFKLFIFTILGSFLWLIPSKFRFRKNVKNQVILVTGAGSGLGRGLALRLAAKGAKLVLWDVDQKLNEQTERLIRHGGGQAKSFICDVSDRKAVREAALKVKAQIGPVTILINNAGILMGKKFSELDEDKIISTMNVNTMAHFWTCKSFLPDMMASKKGHIVCVASVAALLGSPKLTDYCASKYAVFGFMESLRMELDFDGYTGIRTTVICPYFFSSGLYQGLGGDGLLGEMDTDHVADKATEAVLTEAHIAVIPWYLQVILKVIEFIPPLASPTLNALLSIDKMIKDFRGARNITLGIKR